MNRYVSPSTVKTELDLVLFQKYDEKVGMGEVDATDGGIFAQKTTDRAAVITEQFKGVGNFEETAELQALPEDNFRVDNQKTFTVIKYAKAIPVSAEFYADDQHDTVNKAVEQAGLRARTTRDKKAFDFIFNKGFTTTTTNDGVALFSASHLNLNGDTVSNILTSSALSESTLNTAIETLREMVAQDGENGGHSPATLLVPNRLFKTAIEITKSELRSGTANNDANYYSLAFPGLRVVTSRWIGASQGGSDTSWFLLSDNHSVCRWVREPLSTGIVSPENTANDAYIYKMKFREVVGAISYEGIVGAQA